MAAIYTSAVSLIALLFKYIETVFPDRLEPYYDPYSGSIRFAIASLVVIFPLYIFLTKSLNRDLRIHPEKKELWIRRWLIYLTIFIAGVAVVGDLVALINTFLGGELTVRFILKVLVVFVVALAIFGYYFLDLKGVWERNAKLSLRIGWFSLVLIFIVIFSGFFIIGSPETQRMLRFDRQRVEHLQNIQSQIVNYWQTKGKLPETLDNLSDPLVGFTVPRDPKTDAPYEYRRISELTFVLCADFRLESASYPKPAIPRAFYQDVFEANWEHGQGKQCFERTIDPERFSL